MQLRENIEIYNEVLKSNDLIIIIDLLNNKWYHGNQILKVLGCTEIGIIKKKVSPINKILFTELKNDLNDAIHENLIYKSTIHDNTLFINDSGLNQLILL